MQILRNFAKIGFEITQITQLKTENVMAYFVAKAESRIFVVRDRILRLKRSRSLKHVQGIGKTISPEVQTLFSTIFHHTCSEEML